MIATRIPAALFLTAVAAQLPVAAIAASFADPVAIDGALAAFTGAAPGGIGGAAPVDRRLRLAPCAAPLTLAWHGDRHDSILVQCPDPGSWHLFVPVRGAGAAAAGLPAVARGEEVTVSISGDGFSVSQSGEALEGGAVGDWIRVNPTRDAKGTAAPVRAQIVRPGQVAVLLP